MKPLFSRLGFQLVESFAMSDPVYAFDFDGTLAPIVRSPNDAHMSKAVLHSLKALSHHAAVVIISGRSIADLQERVPLRNVTLIGNHGLEGLGSNPETLVHAKGVCKKWDRQIRSALGASTKERGIFIENKYYSLAIHYRLSRNKKKERLKLMELISMITPRPRVILGKCVINLVPQGGPHKGIALLELMKTLRKKSAVYVGDDDTDEDVFGLPDSGLLTVRIGKKKASGAQFFLERQSDIRKMIELSMEARVSHEAS